MKTVAIIQARRGSSRLYNKIFLDLMGNPLIYHVVDRLSKSKTLTDLVIATTSNPIDDPLEKWAKTNKIECFRGHEENVLKRYYDAASNYKADVVVRVTADDPFKDFRLMDEAVQLLVSGNYDFVCNNSPPTFPEGLDVEVLTFNALKKIYRESLDDFEREHVTQYIHRNNEKFKISNIKNNIDLSHYRWTIDEESDYIFTKKIYEKLYKPGNIFLTEEILDLVNIDEKLLKINNSVIRSAQYK